jgi:dipeptidyl aminopeptidase/acylaminoacyl peptidase
MSKHILLLIWDMFALVACATPPVVLTPTSTPAPTERPAPTSTAPPAPTTTPELTPTAALIPTAAPTATAPARPTPEPSATPGTAIARNGRVVYFRFVESQPQPHDELWSVALDGTDDHRLLTCTSECAGGGLAVSPDGTQIAYVVGWMGRGVLHLANANGTNDRAFVKDANEVGAQAFSPDGTRLAFVRFRDAGRAPVPETSIWVVKTSGGTPRQITPWGFFIEPPAWLDNQRLLFSQGCCGTPPTNFQTYRIATQGAARPEMLSQGNLLQVSADRTALLVQVETAPSSEMYDLGLVRLDEGALRLLPLPRIGGLGFTPVAWSPDGAMIVQFDLQTNRLQLLHLGDGSHDELRRYAAASILQSSWVSKIVWDAAGQSIIYSLEELSPCPAPTPTPAPSMTGPCLVETSKLQRLTIADRREQTLTTRARSSPDMVVVAP